MKKIIITIDLNKRESKMPFTILNNNAIAACDRVLDVFGDDNSIKYRIEFIRGGTLNCAR